MLEIKNTLGNAQCQPISRFFGTVHSQVNKITYRKFQTDEKVKCSISNCLKITLIHKAVYGLIACLSNLFYINILLKERFLWFQFSQV